jgi:hypothetical protein
VARGGEDERVGRRGGDWCGGEGVGFMQVPQIKMPADVLRVLLAGRPLRREVFLLPMPQQPGLLGEATEGKTGCFREGSQRLHEQVRGDRRVTILVSSEAWLQLQEDKLLQEVLRVLLHGGQVHLPLQLRELPQRRCQYQQIIMMAPGGIAPRSVPS